MEGHTISYTVRFRDLTTPAQFAHIYIGPATGTGPVDLPFTDQGPLHDLSDRSSGTLTNADIINQAHSGRTDISQIATQIQLGNAYTNIHTTRFPDGEIRGQLALVPAPASLMMMGLGVAGLLGYDCLRRRRASG